MKERLELLYQWLGSDLKLTGFTVTPASEDASFRRYFRVGWDGNTAIVMDAPPGKEDCGPFIDITDRLLCCGVNVPAIKAMDLELGFLLLDDLGEKLYLDVLSAENADTLYADAIRALLQIQNKAVTAGLPPYGYERLAQEMALFSDWLVGRHLQIKTTPAIRKSLNEIFLLLIDSALEQPRVFVHRDYHSRNLMISSNNPGIIDYQDAVFGPATYDLVSLLKDCYIKWPRDRVLQWMRGFQFECRALAAANADVEQVLRWFDLMGVQRHLKASGIFARLLHRDGKSGFIRDIPRTLSYIVELESDYPELQPLTGFIQDRVLPGLARQ